ncbi:MAG: TetR/AcrR family transcriptional regulator [Myxococcota bacterium]
MDARNRSPGLPFASELSHLNGPERLRKEPRQERSRVLTHAIIEATLRVLQREGIEYLTTVRVAEVAGVSIGSLYQYFPNKQALVAALIARYLETLSHKVVEAARCASGSPYREGLQSVTTTFVRAKQDLAEVARALRPLMGQHSSQALAKATRGRVHDSIETLLARFPDLEVKDAKSTAQVLIGAVEGAVAALIVDASPDAPAEDVEQVVFDLARAFVESRAVQPVLPEHR